MYQEVVILVVKGLTCCKNNAAGGFTVVHIDIL